MPNSDSEKKFIFKKNTEKKDNKPELDAVKRDPWKVLVVDDDESVHSLTKMVLKDYSFEGAPLKLLDAFSCKEALEVLQKESDVALIFLDVVMETDDAGLICAREIRNTLGNYDSRIILRTGQPGSAPEKEVIVKYEINDYKEKNELSAQKLFTSVTTSLRDYSNISEMANTSKSLEKLFDVSNILLQIHSFNQIASNVIAKIVSIIEDNPESTMKCSGMWALKEPYDDDYIVRSGIGKYLSVQGKPLSEVVSPELKAEIEKVIRTKTPVFLTDAYIGFSETKRGDGGVILLNWNRTLKDADREVVQLLGANLNAVYEKLSMNNEIVETQNEVIQTFSEVVEGRSLETINHIKRVTEYSCLLAKYLGLSEGDIERIRLAAPMHDVGKVSTPDKILKKPGKLTNEEYGIMQEHSEVGYSIFKKSSLETMANAAVIAYQHHEKWNGKGYPLGLSGEDIHIYSRIVALADVFDALTNKRCYKDAWPLDKVISILKEERGNHFAPDIVDAFFASFEEQKKILERHYTEM